ncbi:MAG: phenylacetate--CoA ligase family protein [Candidatus Lokiarchaeia archaeon]
MSEDLWNPKVEKMPQDEIKELQIRRIRSQINYVYFNSPWYKELYGKANVHPEDIKTLEDFGKLIPVFRKEELREFRSKIGDPYHGMRCTPESHLVQYWSSSGTTGLPTMGAYTRDDLNVAIEYLVRSYWDAGYRPGMKGFGININWHWVAPVLYGMYQVLKITYCFDFFPPPVFAPRAAKCFMFHKFDCIPVSSPEIQVGFIPDLLSKAGYDPIEVLSSVKVMHMLGEPLTTKTRELLKEFYINAKIRDLSGCGETYCWAGETCDEHIGGHIWEDIGYPELVDPDTSELVAPGERGELVGTNLQVKGLPYIRWGSEDWAEIWEEPCERGITHRYARIYDRSAFRTKVKGWDYVPTDVEEILRMHPETMKAQFCLVKYASEMDKLRINIAYDEDVTKDPEELRQRLIKDIKEKLGVAAEINWVKMDELPRPTGFKIKKFLDISKEA